MKKCTVFTFVLIPAARKSFKIQTSRGLRLVIRSSLGSIFQDGRMMLDFSSLDKALQSLNRAVVRARSAPGDEELRDAVIQRFEYCFELSWKMLKRQLEQDVANSSSIDTMSFRELIREGFERGYIANPEDWFLFREHRNTVAHVYNEEKAKTVYISAEKFNTVGRALLEKLKENSND